MNKLFVRIVIVAVFIVLSVVYIYPVLQGLILLPLDLLVSNYAPWHFASTILLKNAYMQDSIIQLFPWRHLTFESLNAGIIPFWNPYQFMGMPFMAGMKSMVWYPLNILFGLGEVASWHALLWFQLFGSLVFMYKLVRELGIKRVPALLSAVSFAFSSLMIGVLEFGSEGSVLMWLPFFLYAAKKYLDSQRRIFLFFLGVALSSAVFAGHLQYLGYEIIVVFAFTFTYGHTIHTRVRSYVSIIIAFALGAGITAIQLIPAVEMFKYSYRGIASSYDVFSSGLLKPYQLIRFIAPDFFGHPLTRDLHMGYIEQSGYFGVVPLFFALYAIVFERKNRMVLFFSLVFGIGILLSLDGIAQALYWFRIPVITSGYGGRIIFITLASGAILAGYGLSSFVVTGHDKRNKFSIIIFVVLVAVLLGASYLCSRLFHWPVPALGNIKFPLIILSLFALVSVLYFVIKKKFFVLSQVIFLAAIVAITYFDLFRLGYRFLTFSNSKFLYPDAAATQFLQQHTQSSMARVFGFAEPELPTYFQIYSPETYNPLYPMQTAVLLHALAGESEKTMPVNKYNLVKGYHLKRILDVTGTSFVVAGKGQDPSMEYFGSIQYQTDLTKVYSDDRFDIYKNNTAFPRFGLYYDVKQNMSGVDILKDMQDESVDLKNTLLLENIIPIAISSGSGSATLMTSSLNSQAYAVDSNSPALLYVSDSYYPGWKATVNGKEEPVYRANYNFRAVLIPTGKSIVIFTYTPSWWGFALGISGVCFVSLSVFSFWKFKKFNRYHKK
jgi:hypothetical protein